MTLGIKYIFRYFLVAPLGIGVSNSNGGKNEADTLVTTNMFVFITKFNEMYQKIIYKDFI